MWNIHTLFGFDFLRELKGCKLSLDGGKKNLLASQYRVINTPHSEIYPRRTFTPFKFESAHLNFLKRENPAPSTFSQFPPFFCAENGPIFIRENLGEQKMRLLVGNNNNPSSSSSNPFYRIEHFSVNPFARLRIWDQQWREKQKKVWKISQKKNPPFYCKPAATARGTYTTTYRLFKFGWKRRGKCMCVSVRPVVFHIVSPSIVVSKSANLPVHALRFPRKNNCSPPPPLLIRRGAGSWKLRAWACFQWKKRRPPGRLLIKREESGGGLVSKTGPLNS